METRQPFVWSRNRERDKFLTVAMVADRLCCSKSHVYKMINDGPGIGGGIAALRIGIKGYRIKESDLEKFLEERSSNFE